LPDVEDDLTVEIDDKDPARRNLSLVGRVADST
jgi:hypothetical protein